MSAKLFYRNVYAVVPRAVVEQYWRKPWDVVLAAAERGENGLTVTHKGRPVLWGGFFAGYRAADPPDVAYLAQGQGGAWEQRCVLHQQNW